MRSSVLCLAFALCVALPHCNARPDTLYSSKKSAAAAAASSSSSEESSETLVKSGGCGCGCGGGAVCASKKSSKKAAAASSSSSSSSSETVAVTGGCSLLTEAQIKEKYAQIKGESLDTYFKRITCRTYEWTSTTDAYVKTLSLVWKDFATLPLWYDRQYLSYTKEFYTTYYTRTKTESVEAYYSRLVTRNAWETEDLFAKRISVLRSCFPQLDLWYSPSWYDKYTKTLYALEYKRFAQESEADYIKRIFERDAGWTDEYWANKLFLIQEATISSCNLWYNKQYLSYFKNFYSIWYKKKASESGDAWLIRALSLLPGESPENALKRITIIKEITSDYGFWTVDYFKKVEVAKCFKSDWLSLVEKTFFPSCGCGGVVVEKSSSKKSAAASSSSSSASSESLKVVSA